MAAPAQFEAFANIAVASALTHSLLLSEHDLIVTQLLIPIGMPCSHSMPFKQQSSYG